MINQEAKKTYDKIRKLTDTKFVRVELGRASMLLRDSNEQNKSFVELNRDEVFVFLSENDSIERINEVVDEAAGKVQAAIEMYEYMASNPNTIDALKAMVYKKR
jgi:hypothetical protein